MTTSTKQKKVDVETLVDTLMAATEASQSDKRAAVPLKAFDGYFPLTIFEMEDLGDAELLFDPKATPRDVNHHSACWVQHPPVDDDVPLSEAERLGFIKGMRGGHDVSVLSFQRTRSASTKELRNAGIKMISPIILLAQIGSLNLRQQKWDSARAFLQYVGKDKWLGATPNNRVIPYEDEAFDKLGKAACMIPFTMRYEWAVRFSYGGCPSFALPCTPQGALILFNDREKPPDVSRRASLLHSVRAHLRVREGKSAVEIRAHLRGAVAFDWRGFRCEIRPSEFDRERARRDDLLSAP